MLSSQGAAAECPEDVAHWRTWFGDDQSVVVYEGIYYYIFIVYICFQKSFYARNRRKRDIPL